MQNGDFVQLVEAGVDLLFYDSRRWYSYDNVGHLLVLHSGLIQYIYITPLYQQAVECFPLLAP